MRIAFVGKGGSGKSTLCALFSTYFGLSSDSNSVSPVWLFDADLNMHQHALCGLAEFTPDMLLSTPKNVTGIREWLLGSSKHITSLEHFVKTSPPSVGSRLFDADSIGLSPLSNLRRSQGRLSLFTIGTYDASHSGTQCFHNNLAILENVLSHISDDGVIVVADMVAGSDAFASSLHLLFDVFALVIEPAPESVDVALQFIDLAKEVGIYDRVVLVGNKISSADDVRYITDSLSTPPAVLVADQPEIKTHRRSRLPLSTLVLPTELRSSLHQILSIARARIVGFTDRVSQLRDLHRRYVAQGYILDRLGDISSQADANCEPRPAAGSKA